MEKEQVNKKEIRTLIVLVVFLIVLCGFNIVLFKTKTDIGSVLEIWLLPILTAVIIYLLGQYISPKLRDKYEIEECQETFDETISAFSWNYKQPLKILTTAFIARHIPRYENLEKFNEIQVVIDMSRKTIDARTTAVPERKNNYLTIAWNGTKLALSSIKTKKEKFKNFKIVAADLKQYPVGMIISNGRDIFYAPLWNHSISDSDIFNGLCLRIDSKSRFGKELLASFDNLFNKGTEISNFNIDILQTCYGYTNEELKEKEENA